MAPLSKKTLGTLAHGFNIAGAALGVLSLAAIALGDPMAAFFLTLGNDVSNVVQGNIHRNLYKDNRQIGVASAIQTAATSAMYGVMGLTSVGATTKTLRNVGVWTEGLLNTTATVSGALTIPGEDSSRKEKDVFSYIAQVGVSLSFVSHIKREQRYLENNRFEEPVPDHLLNDVRETVRTNFVGQKITSKDMTNIHNMMVDIDPRMKNTPVFSYHLPEGRPPLKGFYDSTGDELWLARNLDPLEQEKAAFHEMAHKIHFLEEKRKQWWYHQERRMNQTEVHNKQFQNLHAITTLRAYGKGYISETGFRNHYLPYTPIGIGDEMDVRFFYESRKRQFNMWYGEEQQSLLDSSKKFKTFLAETPWDYMNW